MLDPNYIVGFVDGEGCFCISINKPLSVRPEVRLFFEIELREDDLPILQSIQKVLGCGQIYTLRYERYEKWRPHVKYKVGGLARYSVKNYPILQTIPAASQEALSI